MPVVLCSEHLRAKLRPAAAPGPVAPGSGLGGNGWPCPASPALGAGVSCFQPGPAGAVCKSAGDEYARCRCSGGWREELPSCRGALLSAVTGASPRPSASPAASFLGCFSLPFSSSYMECCFDLPSALCCGASLCGRGTSLSPPLLCLWMPLESAAVLGDVVGAVSMTIAFQVCVSWEPMLLAVVRAVRGFP